MSAVVPGVVTGFPGGGVPPLLPDPPPPQPGIRHSAAKQVNAASFKIQRRRPAETPKSRTNARAAPPLPCHRLGLAYARFAMAAAVVLIVQRVSTAWVLVIVICAGLKLHVGRLMSPVFFPFTVHVIFTAPVKPPPGDTPTVGAIDPPGKGISPREHCRTLREAIVPSYYYNRRYR